MCGDISSVVLICSTWGIDPKAFWDSLVMQVEVYSM